MDNTQIRIKTKQLALHVLKQRGNVPTTELAAILCNTNGWTMKKQFEILNELVTAGEIVKEENLFKQKTAEGSE